MKFAAEMSPARKLSNLRNLGLEFSNPRGTAMLLLPILRLPALEEQGDQMSSGLSFGPVLPASPCASEWAEFSAVPCATCSRWLPYAASHCRKIGLFSWITIISLCGLSPLTNRFAGDPALAHRC